MLQKQSSWCTMANPRDKHRVSPSMLLFHSHFQHKNRSDQHSAVERRTMVMHEPSLRAAARKRPLSQTTFPDAIKAAALFAPKRRSYAKGTARSYAAPYAKRPRK